MTSPLFISFHSGPGYADEAKGLQESLAALDLPSLILGERDAGTWIANCAQKPCFLRRIRATLDGPIVWLDADARVLRMPVLFNDLTCDIALHVRTPERGKPEMLSGTIYLGNTDGACEILYEWCEEQERQPQMWDQRTLQRVLEANPDRWDVVHLPETYCAIFDKGIQDPVIEHRQASRRLKVRPA